MSAVPPMGNCCANKNTKTIRTSWTSSEERARSQVEVTGSQRHCLSIRRRCNRSLSLKSRQPFRTSQRPYAKRLKNMEIRAFALASHRSQLPLPGHQKMTFLSVCLNGLDTNGVRQPTKATLLAGFPIEQMPRSYVFQAARRNYAQPFHRQKFWRHEQMKSTGFCANLASRTNFAPP